MAKFNTSYDYLSARLFFPETPKIGAKTALNVNVLPELSMYLKQQMSQQQLLCLSQYHLQTYLMELAVHAKSNITLERLSQQTLQHLRSHKQFWHKLPCTQIQSNQKLKQNCAIIQYQNNINDLMDTYIDNDDEDEYNPIRSARICSNYSYQIQNNKNNNNKIIMNNYLSMLSTNTQSLTQQQQKCILYYCQFRKNIIDNQKQLTNKTINKQEIDVSYESQEYQIFHQKLSLNENYNNKMFMNCNQCYLSKNIMEIMRQMKLLLSTTTKINPIIEKQPSFQYKVSSIQTIQSEIDQKILNRSEITVLAQYFTKYYSTKGFQNSFEMIKQQYNSFNINSYKDNQLIPGFLQNLSTIKSQLQQFRNISQHPQHIKLQQYRVISSSIPWQTQHYKIFLKALNEYFNMPTNNKKIVQYIQKQQQNNNIIIQPNHVKYIKGIYLRNMNIRIENGQCGAGKKGQYISKKEFLKKDIESFSMKWFNKVKKKKNKKKQSSSDTNTISEIQEQYQQQQNYN